VSTRRSWARLLPSWEELSSFVSRKLNGQQAWETGGSRDVSDSWDVFRTANAENNIYYYHAVVRTISKKLLRRLRGLFSFTSAGESGASLLTTERCATHREPCKPKTSERPTPLLLR